MWAHIRLNGRGSWWMRQTDLPRELPADWTVLGVYPCPTEYWMKWRA